VRGRAGDASEISNHSIDVGVRQVGLIETAHLHMPPSAHRGRIAHQCPQTKRREVSRHRHRLAEIGSLVASTGSPQTVAGQALYRLAAPGWITCGHAGVECKLRPTLQRIGIADQACKRVGSDAIPERSGCCRTR
jgi:hypothetical protein